jgi:hypothetical protein
MSLEDQLSKIPDSSDWGLVRTEYRRICEAFGVRPSIDLFASASWHHTPQFISGSYAPGGKAVNALQMAWSDIVREGEFAWVFPPVRYINQVIQLARKYKTNMVLLVPDRQATNWWISLEQLGSSAAKLEGPIVIP